MNRLNPHRAPTPPAAGQPGVYLTITLPLIVGFSIDLYMYSPALVNVCLNS